MGSPEQRAALDGPGGTMTAEGLDYSLQKLIEEFKEIVASSGGRVTHLGISLPQGVSEWLEARAKQRNIPTYDYAARVLLAAMERETAKPPCPHIWRFLREARKDTPGQVHSHKTTDGGVRNGMYVMVDVFYCERCLAYRAVTPEEQMRDE